ncbi:MAG TPA: recombinase family protein [Woeseiaceae bacterium]
MKKSDTSSLKRCAIYTRKSFQPPLAQEITSLEAQRKICGAYITSQQHRGWLEISRLYDDVGRTGSNTDRPALQSLLADVEAGLIDVVLVYKLDRLTRTLFDFVRLMDFLERHGVALVSITQNFDTSDSLGRLVLNVLLTFAQFEREIMSDRMRDKIRVLREMGHWVGGSPPLGYDVTNRKLVINPFEGEAVRMIFRTFIETQSTEAVHRKLRDAGFRRKTWRSRNGNVWGGGPVMQSALHHILRNPIYIGEVRHRGDRFTGIHQPLVERSTFDEVQRLLAEHSVRRPRQVANLLTGILFDSSGRPMCVKAQEYRGRQLRYYASNFTAWARRQRLKRMRANADEVEQVLIAALQSFLQDRKRVREMLLVHGIHGPELDRLTRAGSSAARQLGLHSERKLNDILHGILERVELGPEHLTAIIIREEMRRFLAWDGVGMFGIDHDARRRNGAVHFLQVAVSAVRETKLFALPIVPAAIDSPSRPDLRLVRLLEEAGKARDLMTVRRDLDIAGLSAELNMKMCRFSRLVRLNYLAPDIALAIRDGTQPAGLTRRALLKTDLPLDWAVQRRLLGFPHQPEHCRNPGPPAAIESAVA